MSIKLIFNAQEHSYTGEKIKFTSVSSLISKYKKPYNKSYWSTYKAYEKILGKDEFKALRKDAGYGIEDPMLFDFLSYLVTPNELDTEIKKVLLSWDKERNKSIVKGNDYHLFKENQAKDLGYSINPFNNEKYETIESVNVEHRDGVEYRSPIFSNLYDLPDGFHPELMLWNVDAKLAGQSDMVYISTVGDKRFVDISDYKTNKKIDKFSVFGKMQDPLSHLDCCNYNHYRLQISAYAWMLKQAGFIPRHLEFRHLNKPYVFDYMKDIETIIPNYNF
jgi:hypothetical protein